MSKNQKASIIICVLLITVIFNLPAAADRLDYNPVGKGLVGKTYEAMVPDTLDLADRMALATTARPIQAYERQFSERLLF